MTMRLLGWGMLVVLVDLNLHGFDVLPDVVGWAMVTLALWDLCRLAGQLNLARLAAVLGTLAAALAFALFFSEQPLRALRMLTDLTVAVSWWAMCWWTLRGLADAARASQPGVAVQASRLARVLAVANGVGVLIALVQVVAALVHDDYRAELAGPAALLVAAVAVLVVVVNLAMVVFCFRHADSHWALTGRRGGVAPVEPLGH